MHPSNIHAAVRVRVVKLLKFITVVALAKGIPVNARPVRAIESHHNLNVSHKIFS